MQLKSDNKLITLQGTVFGNSLVVDSKYVYKLKGDKLFSGKKGWFSVKNGIVYRFLPKQ